MVKTMTFMAKKIASPSRVSVHRAEASVPSSAEIAAANRHP